MAYLLDSTTLKRPNSVSENNSTQIAVARTLSGAVNTDHFGSNKRAWTLSYSTVNKTDFDIIDAIYQSYLSDGTPKTFQITESNYPVSETQVHVDLRSRDFNVKGSSYISDFDLVLTER